MEHDLYPNDFWHKRKMDNFDPFNVLLAIAANIPVLLMTAFVLQDHIRYTFCYWCKHRNTLHSDLFTEKESI